LKINKKQLPKGIRKYIKYQKSIGGIVKLSYDNIQKGTIKKGKIVDCIYFEDDTKLEWFSNEGILYIMVNDVKVAYYEK